MADQRITSPGFLKVYPSKRDTWVSLLVWTGAAVLLSLSVAIMTLPLPLMVRLGLFLLYVATGVFGIWVLYSTSYTLTDHNLLVRCGPFKWRIDLDTIKKVSPSRSALSSPACSLDRLHVRYGGRKTGLLISPRDKDAFLRDLTERCPRLIPDGEELRRVDAP